MKYFKSLSILLLSSLFIFAAISCNNETPTPAPNTKTIKEVSTNGTVTGVTTNDKGLLTATLETADGTYLFIESPLNTNESEKTGTWTYTEVSQTKPTYSGSYTGNISKLANEATTLTLIVKKALVNGELKRVTTTKSFDFEASETDFEATIPRVEVNTTNVYETPTATLPDSVGDNPFAGKTFINYWDNGSEDNPETKTETWVFSEFTVTKFVERSWTDDYTDYYEYSYDSTQNLLYLACKKSEIGNYSYTNYSEYVQMMLKLNDISINDVPEFFLLTQQSFMIEQFGFYKAYQYEIDNSLETPSLKFTDYFNGTFPSNSRFWSINSDWESHDSPSLSTEGPRIWLWQIGSTGNGDGYICWPLVYEDNTISGIITAPEVDFGYYCGEFECYYTSTGKGDSNCTLTFIFTELPADIPDFSTYTEYVLTN